MATTIQLQDGTVALLKKLRSMKDAKSYDEVVATLAKKELKPKSGFGMFRGRITRKDLDRFIREEHVEP